MQPLLLHHAGQFLLLYRALCLYFVFVNRANQRKLQWEVLKVS